MTGHETEIDLKPLTIDLVPMFTGCLISFPKQNCDLNLCNVFTWGLLYKLHHFTWQNAHVIYNPRYHYLAFPFCYKLGAADLADLVRRFRSVDPKTEMILFPQDWLQEHPEVSDLFRLRTHEVWSDYVYLAENLSELPGRKLAKKKNLISQFLRQHPDYEVRNIEPEDRDSILDHFGKWQTNRNIKDPTLTLEYRAVKNSFLYWDRLPNDGLKIILDGEIIAWSIFSPQTADMVTVHFEKYDPALKGCAQLINWETAKHLRHYYTYINREQDMGLPGLRQAKRSYEPEFMVPFITSRLR